MDIAERKEGNVAVVDVSGRMVASENAGQLKERITQLIFRGDKQIVVNLNGVTYIDSSGLGELVACHSSAMRGGGTVKLSNASGRIQDLLVMTKLLTVFDCYDSEAGAISSFTVQ